jgi:hypothetical protein
MLKRILKNDVLGQFVEEDCCEEGVCVTFDPKISKDSYVILKVDKFYNSLKQKVRPSIDCLIIRKCKGGGYGMTLVELKSISSSGNFDIQNLRLKFETTLFDFVQKRFKDILDQNYADIKLIFVSNIELHKRDLGLKMEVLINTRFKFNDQILMIVPFMPSPTIRKCYA